MAKKTFTVPVRFTGKIEYQISADTENKAITIAEEMAADENNLGELSDIEWAVKQPIETSN